MTLSNERKRAIGVGIALKIQDPDLRRALLRRCAHTYMGTRWTAHAERAVTNELAKPDVAISPKTRATVAGLRDALPPETLTILGMANVASGDAVVRNLSDDRIEPLLTSTPKSYYHHVVVGHHVFDDMLARLNKKDCLKRGGKTGYTPGRRPEYPDETLAALGDLAFAVAQDFLTKAADPARELADVLDGLGLSDTAKHAILAMRHAGAFEPGATGKLAIAADDFDTPFTSSLPSNPSSATSEAASVTPNHSKETTTVTKTETETAIETTTVETTTETTTMTEATAPTAPVAEAAPPVPVASSLDPKLFEIPTPKPGSEVGVNMMLDAAGLPRLEELFDRMNKMADAVRTAESGIGERIADALRKSATASAPLTASPDGAIPEGKVVFKKASDVFGLSGPAAAAFSFEVPTFDWAFPHPAVPTRDAEYVFRPPALVSLLLALSGGKQRPWIYGHTGCGKSTLVEQVCAALQWPMLRVNFDSEITRADLIGSMSLIVDPTTGKTVTKFLDGVLPMAVAGPYVLLLDEVDFVRPDVSYVLQRALEGKGVLVNEDGGRFVPAHPMSRIVATANTVGLGDEHGMYQGARPQSRALLDRFAPFIHIPYLDAKNERALILKRVPKLDPKDADMIAQYVTEHRQAFENAEIAQPLSPRGIVGLAEQYVAFLSVYPDKKKAFARAFEDIISSRSDSSDRAVIVGLLNRVMK
jgi:cobaltochelatase CobS subunit